MEHISHSNITFIYRPLRRGQPLYSGRYGWSQCVLYSLYIVEPLHKGHHWGRKFWPPIERGVLMICTKKATWINVAFLERVSLHQGWLLRGDDSGTLQTVLSRGFPLLRGSFLRCSTVYTGHSYRPMSNKN